jgi:hypothetical protein
LQRKLCEPYSKTGESKWAIVKMDGCFYDKEKKDGQMKQSIELQLIFPIIALLKQI